MSLIARLKPKFWDHHDVAAGHHPGLFSFRRKWKLLVLLTAVVAIAPLCIMTLVGINLTRGAVESEIHRRTAQATSNTWRTVSFFLAEHQSALEFIVQDNRYQDLSQSSRLAAILESLTRGVGGFVDLGVVGASGTQIAYSGPYPLSGKNYCDTECFKQIRNRRVFISEITLRDRPLHHIDMAVKQDLPDGSFFVLRAALDIRPVNQLLSQLDVGATGDAFIINRQGVLQTPSRFHGGVHQKILLAVPPEAAKTKVYETAADGGDPLLVGYAYIPDTSFILMVVTHKNELMGAWQRARTRIIGFLVPGILIILLVVLGMATYLVNRIHSADQRRVQALHQVEYANKMASIGRLSAGVAHEINNPLGIINQKAGLIKDIFTFRPEYKADQKINRLLDDVVAAVQRCGEVTRRLLNFARHSETRLETILLGEVLGETLKFFHKEAEHRNISATLDVSAGIPPILSDRGSLEQIFLNLLNNAFEAMKDGGRLEITASPAGGDAVEVVVSDTGHGIDLGDLKRVFDPFFTTQSGKSGTGLGLSITYGLVRRLGGSIDVQSQVGQGTRFIISLPLKTVIEQDSLETL